MNQYIVTLELHAGYHGTTDESGCEVLDYESPKIKHARFFVEADTESHAIAEAKKKDKSKLSVQNAYAQLQCQEELENDLGF